MKKIIKNRSLKNECSNWQNCRDPQLSASKMLGAGWCKELSGKAKTSSFDHQSINSWNGMNVEGLTGSSERKWGKQLKESKEDIFLQCSLRAAMANSFLSGATCFNVFTVHKLIDCRFKCPYFSELLKYFYYTWHDAIEVPSKYTWMKQSEKLEVIFMWKAESR